MSWCVGVAVDEHRASRRPRTTASAVAMNVLAGRITSSPAADAGGPQRELEGVGAVGHADAVGHAAERGELRLERGDVGAVDEGGGGQDSIEPLGHVGGDLACCQPRSTRGILGAFTAWTLLAEAGCGWCGDVGA